MNFISDPFISFALNNQLSFVCAFFLYEALQFIFVAIILLVLTILYAILDEKLSAKLSKEESKRKSILEITKSLFSVKNYVHTDKFTKLLLPLFTVVPIIFVWTLIPFSNSLINTETETLLFLGLIFLPIAGGLISALSTNDKQAQIVAIRGCVQKISFIPPIILSVISIFVLADSISMNVIVNFQKHCWFIIPSLFGFVVMLIGFLAILNIAPFEYEENKTIPLNKFSKCTATVVICAFLATLFLGGYLPIIPFNASQIAKPLTLEYNLINNFKDILWVAIKTFALLLAVIKIKVSIPKIRTDMANTLVWKYLLPISIINLMVVCLVKFGGFYA